MYMVILAGVRHGVVRSEAVINLAILFKTTPDNVENMLATSMYVLKKGVSEEAARKFRLAIEAAGGECRMEHELSPVETLDVDLPQSSLSQETPKNNQNLITCNSCGADIAKSADNCPKCGAINEWADPRRDELVNFLNISGRGLIGESWQFYGDRYSIWGNTDLKMKSHEALRYALMAFVIGIVLNFLSRPLLVLANKMGPIVQIIITFVPFFAYPAALFFFAKWIYHAVFTSDTNDYVQKKFRVDYSGKTPAWESNDDNFWKPIKEYVMKNNPDIFAK